MQGFAGGAPNHSWDSELRLETFGILPGTRGAFRLGGLLVIIIATAFYLQALTLGEL